MKVSSPFTVMAGRVPAIHVFAPVEDVGGRNKCGHDVRCLIGKVR